MKFTAFNGSPAGEKSAAGRMLGVFLAGAARAGAETELYHLGDYSIGQCVQHDDMEKLLRAYQSADVVCLDSPVYSWNMTALLKNFTDRLIPLKSPLLTEQAGYEFAAQGEVTAEPRTQLDAPLMSAAEYVQFLGM
ncbi:MAG: flavodoxin family protein [Butyricicoccus sp.]|nr:NAD(P)H-dependent oxidoreductase [Agathobaculum butyriciproducens]